MEPSDSDESSGAHAADVVMEDLLLGPSRKRKIESSSVAHAGDVVMEETQDGPSPKKVDIHRAIDLMRFVFREGMPFLDNGSGRSFAERMIVDMSGFMVDMMFQDPGISQQNAPGRMWTMTPTLDKDIAHAFAKETRKGVSGVVQGDFYGIFVDTIHIPSTIMSCMVLFVRYLNGEGDVVERLLGVVPDPDFGGLSIKVMVDSMLSEAGLSLSKLRGQGHGLFGYDDEIFTELKTLITNENGLEYYVHPYLCQMHSSLVHSSYGQFKVYELFQTVDALSNLIKDCPQFTEKVCSLIQERGWHLASDLKKPGETSWGSYYEALVKFAAYFDPICDALYFVSEEVKDHDQTYLAYKVLKGLSYDFAFGLLLMQDVLGVTNELSLALDRKYVDAENCMALLQEAKKQLQVMRDEGWTSFLNKVGLFCSENEFPMPNMGTKFEPRPRLRGNAPTMTNLEHYHIDFFEKVINIHLNEFDKRFSKQSSSLFVLSSCLNPQNAFQAFDKEKLLEYARLYPSDFSDSDIATLDLQLEAFVADMRSDVRFREMSALSELSVKMVETGKSTVYPLVYLLLKLALILPGTPATAKTASSAIKFIDSTMQEEPCNQWISDCLLLFLERDIFESVTNDAVIASL
ncbi:uncharacterized protein [Miscanthus floridulus]|uniref:uncharacterized protein n=1 Tax=Miscanthus floridulus TaxID=154761 RepID=UPI00345AE770